MNSTVSFTSLCRKAAALSGLLLLPSAASASGFYILEQSSTLLGNAFAGAAASAEDASTNFYNPAGLVYLDGPQIQTGLSYITIEAEWNDRGTYNSISGQPVQGGSNVDGGTSAPVPTLYYAQPINDRLAFGFGLNAPFGLVTEYEDGWVGRYTALKSDLMTLNFNPNVAYRITDKLSVAAGIMVQYCDAELSNAIDFSTVVVGSVANGAIPATALPDGYLAYSMASLGSTAQDGKAVVSGDSVDFGFNLGIMYEFDPTLRLGLNFRSKVKHNLKGDADFTLPNDAVISALFGGRFYDQSINADLTTPEVLSLSLYKSYRQWEFLADISWTNWSRFEDLYIDFEDAATPDTDIEERWTDVIRASLGFNYSLSDKLKLRAGIAYDEAPSQEDNYRSPRIPDEDRFWISTGLTYNINEKLHLSAAYTYIFVDDPYVNNDTHTAGNVLIGEYDASVSILSLGISYNF
ncbi:MAG: outer membrane protein transport protein [Opitutales bacterium]|nr:outer membrane protein transport protein [Opitutales bacterium]